MKFIWLLLWFQMERDANYFGGMSWDQNKDRTFLSVDANDQNTESTYCSMHVLFWPFLLIIKNSLIKHTHGSLYVMSPCLYVEFIY